jgi:RNA polymerase sigma-70 factor (ECF subfamily)
MATLNRDKEEINLINAARTDPEAFGELYQRYVVRIYNYIFYRTGNAHDAEDITARVFFKALKNIGSYRHMGLPFSSWLYRIAHNLVANFHRDSMRIKEISLENNPHPNLTTRQEFPEVNLTKEQDVGTLLEIISDLPRIRQELIILKFVEKLSNAEIAKIMRKSEGAIKSLYHRTLMDLRERIRHTPLNPE